MSKETPAHHLPVVHPPKRLWQKISAIIAQTSFGLAAIGVVAILVYGSDVTADIKAALGGHYLFLFCCCLPSYGRH